MNLVDCLSPLNKWWATGKVEPVFLFKRIRSEFSLFVRNISSDKIIAATGPNGCGKTTLFYHTIDYLLKLKTPPERILMFRADEPSLFIKDATLAEIIKAYTSAMLNEDIEALSRPVYIFIDDIYRLKNWSATVRRYHDKGVKLKFIVSAPTRSLLFAQDRDEMGGRCTQIPILPLSVAQFIEFHGVYRQTGFDNITYKSLMPRHSLLDNPREYVNALLGNIHPLSAFRAEKISLLSEYMLAGGYPGFFGCDNISIWHHKLTDEIIDFGLYHDILSNYNIKAPEKFKMLLYLIAADNGREQAFAQIGKNLSLNTVTVISHLNLLRENRIVSVCENYSGKKFGVSRKNKRIYLRDGGIKNALLRRDELGPSELTDELINTMINMGSDFIEKNAGSVCFWRTGQSEADFVLDKGFTLLPVLINLKNVLSKRDIRGLNSFGRTYFNRDAVVITKDTLAIENNIYYVPYWLL